MSSCSILFYIPNQIEKFQVNTSTDVAQLKRDRVTAIDSIKIEIEAGVQGVSQRPAYPAVV